MNLFIYRIIYAVLWSYCPENILYVHTEREWANSVLAVRQLEPLKLVDSPAVTYGRLRSTASREASLVFRCGVCGATEVICLHPGIREASVELPLPCVSRHLLRYMHSSDLEDFMEVAHAYTDAPPFTHTLCLPKRIAEKKKHSTDTGTSGIAAMPQIPALWSSQQTF